MGQLHAKETSDQRVGWRWQASQAEGVTMVTQGQQSKQIQISEVDSL